MPLAHKHSIVTKLMLLVDGKNDAVNFDDMFSRQAIFQDPIGTVHRVGAIQRAWEIRSSVFKPHAPDLPHGGASRGQSTLVLSVQPQSDTACHIRMEKAYVLRDWPHDSHDAAFTMRTTIYFELDPNSGKITALEDKWDEVADWSWCRRGEAFRQGPQPSAVGAGSASPAPASCAAPSPAQIPLWARVLALARSKAGMPVDACFHSHDAPRYAAVSPGGEELFSTPKPHQQTDESSRLPLGQPPGPLAAAHAVMGPHSNPVLGDVATLARQLQGHSSTAAPAGPGTQAQAGAVHGGGSGHN